MFSAAMPVQFVVAAVLFEAAAQPMGVVWVTTAVVEACYQGSTIVDGIACLHRRVYCRCPCIPACAFHRWSCFVAFVLGGGLYAGGCTISLPCGRSRCKPPAATIILYLDYPKWKTPFRHDRIVIVPSVKSNIKPHCATSSAPLCPGTEASTSAIVKYPFVPLMPTGPLGSSIYASTVLACLDRTGRALMKTQIRIAFPFHPVPFVIGHDIVYL